MDMAIIIETITTYAPDCDVLAFGSRYKWTAKDSSDLDLAFVGKEKLGIAKRARIEAAFEASNLPYRVDVVDYNSISNAFRAVVDGGNEQIYRKSEASRKWRKVRLGDICKINEQVYLASEKWPFVNYLDTRSITRNHIDEIRHIVAGKDALPGRARHKVTSGDIIYSTVQPNRRHYGILKDVRPNMLVSADFAVITVDGVAATSNFIYYYLTQDNRVNSLQAIGEQSALSYSSIRPSDIEDLEVLLPPMSEQIEIERILRALDDKIESNAMTNLCLASAAGLLFKEWFVDHGPLSGEMPNEWGFGGLGGAAAVTGGKRPMITQADLENVRIVLPDKAALLDFENLVGPLMELFDCNVNESKKLAVLRDALLPSLMSGKLPVAGLTLQYNTEEREGKQCGKQERNP
jgi:predicted nucleotidyltransferase